ncbi:MAG: hypothetical protein WAK82_26440 [Streptosporangiaceae bacterium]
MADRADWESATRAQRQLAIAADAELRRRHPGQPFAPLRSAEPRATTDAQRAELTPTASHRPTEPSQRIKNLAAARQTFISRLADRQSLLVPSEDPDYGNLGQVFPPWIGLSDNAILQPPELQIPPSPQVMQRALDRDAEWEAAD